MSSTGNTADRIPAGSRREGGGSKREPRVFAPHPECMVASGECFTVGRCLAKCKSRTFYQHQHDLRQMQERMAQLEYRIIMLERGRAG